MKTLLGKIRRNRLADIAVFAAIILAVLTVLRLLPEVRPVEVSGAARIIDGDSIIVRGIEIRLRGIDAPEREQSCSRSTGEWPCGAEAARQLARKVRGHTLRCSGQGHDAHDRLLAVCSLGEIEINRWLVEQGLAVSYDDYPAAERAARNAKRGIWSGTFVRPRDWREEHR